MADPALKVSDVSDIKESESTDPGANQPSFSEDLDGTPERAAADATTSSSRSNDGARENESDRSVDLEFILDIPLKVNVELGRTKILVQDLLKLHKGSVIELTKLVGEPLEVLVNDRVVAKGEVIIVNEKFGIRLIDVMSHQQRVLELGGSE